MGVKGHFSFSRVNGTMAEAFEKERKDNAALLRSSVARPQPAQDHDQGENVQARIAENDFIVDISIYGQEWTPPTPAIPKGVLLQRAVVTGVHKGEIKVGTQLDYIHLVEAPWFPKPFRSVVEGELRTFFFSKEDALLKEGNYTVEGDGHSSFTPQESDFVSAFEKELKSNPELRGSYRAVREKDKE